MGAGAQATAAVSPRLVGTRSADMELTLPEVSPSAWRLALSASLVALPQQSLLCLIHGPSRGPQS